MAQRVFHVGSSTLVAQRVFYVGSSNLVPFFFDLSQNENFSEIQSTLMKLYAKNDDKCIFEVIIVDR